MSGSPTAQSFQSFLDAASANQLRVEHIVYDGASWRIIVSRNDDDDSIELVGFERSGNPGECIVEFSSRKHPDYRRFVWDLENPAELKPEHLLTNYLRAL